MGAEGDCIGSIAVLIFATIVLMLAAGYVASRFDSEE